MGLPVEVVVPKIAKVFAKVCNEHPEFTKRMSDVCKKIDTRLPEKPSVEHDKVQTIGDTNIIMPPQITKFKDMISQLKDTAQESHEKRVARAERSLETTSSIADGAKRVAEMEAGS